MYHCENKEIGRALSALGLPISNLFWWTVGEGGGLKSYSKIKLWQSDNNNAPAKLSATQLQE